MYLEHKLGYIAQPRRKILTQKGGEVTDENRTLSLELINDQLYFVRGAGGRIAIVDVHSFKLDSLNLDSMILTKQFGGTLKYIHDIHHDKIRNKTWITKRGKLFYRSGDQWLQLAMPQLNMSSLGIRFYFSHDLYKTNYALLAYYRNKFFIIADDTISYVSDKFPKRITDVMVVGDSIFISTLQGLYLQIEDHLTYLGEQYPELKEPAYDLTYFNNKPWISTIGKGVYVLHDDSIQEIRFQNNTIYSPRLLQPNSNELWLMSEQGSFLFDLKKHPSGTKRINLEAFAPYRLKSAIKKAVVSPTTYYEGTTNKGVGMIQFKDVKIDTLFPPRLLFSELKIGGKKRLPSDSLFSLAYNESFIQITYKGVSYRNRDIHYQHRMLGLQQDWTETDENYIQFTTLPAGAYTFEVRCRRGNESWSEARFLHFEISPPFWKTWWFIVITGVVLIWTSFQLINYRLKIVQKEKTLLVDRLKAEQKALRAQMSPHFIFNIITSIRYIVNNESKNKVNLFLDMFSHSMRSILNQANENHVTIENEIKILKEYIEMERFRLEGKFDYEIQQIQLKDQLDKLLPPFVIQPFVENAIQHGLKNKDEGGFLNLRFEAVYPFLEVSIEDNGIGREQANYYKKNSTEKSHGIRIIKERLAIHNGKDNNVHIEDLFDTHQKAVGTLVTIRIRILEKVKKHYESAYN